jgi:hypothetical protein
MSFMLSVIMLNVFYAECHNAECGYAECRYAECRGAIKSDVFVTRFSDAKSYSVDKEKSLKQ